MSDSALVKHEEIFAALVEWDAACRRQGGWVRHALHLGIGTTLSVQRSAHHRCNLSMNAHLSFDEILSGAYEDHTLPSKLDFEVWYPGDDDPTGYVEITDLVKQIQARGGLLPLKVQAVLNRLNNPNHQPS